MDDTITERQKRYYDCFSIDPASTNVGGGIKNIENTILCKEKTVRNMLTNCCHKKSVKIKLTCSGDRMSSKKLNTILEHSKKIRHKILEYGNKPIRI